METAIDVIHGSQLDVIKFQVVKTEPVPASEVCEQASLLNLRVFTCDELDPYVDGLRHFSVDQTHLVAVGTSEGPSVYVAEFFLDEKLQEKAKVRPIGAGENPGCNPNLPWLFVNVA